MTVVVQKMGQRDRGLLACDALNMRVQRAKCVVGILPAIAQTRLIEDRLERHTLLYQVLLPRSSCGSS